MSKKKAFIHPSRLAKLAKVPGSAASRAEVSGASSGSSSRSEAPDVSSNAGVPQNSERKTNIVPPPTQPAPQQHHLPQQGHRHMPPQGSMPRPQQPGRHPQMTGMKRPAPGGPLPQRPGVPRMGFHNRPPPMGPPGGRRWGAMPVPGGPMPAPGPVPVPVGAPPHTGFHPQPVPMPVKPVQQNADNPALRTEAKELVAGRSGAELAATIAHAISTELLTPEVLTGGQYMVRSTLRSLSYSLGVGADKIGKFEVRVTDQVQKCLRKFMRVHYKQELTQLIEALTYTPQGLNVDMLSKQIEIMIGKSSPAVVGSIRDELKALRDGVRDKEEEDEEEAKGPYKMSLPALALRGDLSTIRNLIVEGQDPSQTDSAETGYTALMNATLHGHSDLVRYLLSLGNDKCALDAQDKDGFTALMYAATYERIDILKDLVTQGASVYAQDKKGRTVFHFARSPGVRQALDALVASLPHITS